MSIKKLSMLTSAALLLLSACTTSGERVEPQKSEEAKPVIAEHFNHEWIDEVPNYNGAIRACIIAHKSTESIRYISKEGEGTRVVIENDGKLQNCDLNSAGKIIATRDRESALPESLPRFYPYGKNPKNCSTQSKVNDERGRLMGVACRV